jgi:hypothetical protein
MNFKTLKTCRTVSDNRTNGCNVIVVRIFKKVSNKITSESVRNCPKNICESDKSDSFGRLSETHLSMFARVSAHFGAVRNVRNEKWLF